MAVNEIREQLRSRLEEDYGVEGATYLMDRPPGGWSDLVTKDYLDAKLDALRHELLGSMDRLSGSVDRRLRAQTWITTGTLITGLAVVFGVAQAL